jgi:hypothetical protein
MLTNNNPPAQICACVVTIDRDAQHFMRVSKALVEAMGGTASRIIVICRTTDVQVKALWENIGAAVHCVGPYIIPPNARHNMKAIAMKRNVARTAAMARGYGAVCFVDSDVVVQPHTICLLAQSLKMFGGVADVSTVPSSVRWLDNQIAVGVESETPGKRWDLKILPPFLPLSLPERVFLERCAIAWMGCTAIGKESLIDIAFDSLLIYDETSQRVFYGEDISYFLQLKERHRELWMIRNHEVLHL